MKERLKAAMQSIAEGESSSIVMTAEQLKELPRTAEGLFDTSVVDSDFYEAARWVYPVYAAYETECNKKEGYPDLLHQMRLIDRKYGEESGNLPDTARYLDLLIHTIDNVTPQLYEYYRELADIFKARLREAIRTYYHDGRFAGRDGSVQEEAECMIRSAVRRACENYVLLGEKYQEYQ